MEGSQFRQDVVTGDWVLIAPGRGKRPHYHDLEHFEQAIDTCPFEPERMHEQADPVLLLLDGNEVSWRGAWTDAWDVAVLGNKFPALSAGVCGDPTSDGLYRSHPGFGFHELVVTREHGMHLADLSKQQVAHVLTTYHMRYRSITSQPCGAYVSIFHNHGKRAGASLAHNHSQILSTPIVPPEVYGAVRGADAYSARTGRRVYDDIVAHELRHGTRVVYENEDMIVLCPYASKAPFEMMVLPRHHAAQFQDATPADLSQCADALRVALIRLRDVVGDPDYNMFLATTPVHMDGVVDPQAYRWHMRIVPRIPIAAGFELATAVYVNPTDPDQCAQELRA